MTGPGGLLGILKRRREALLQAARMSLAAAAADLLVQAVGLPQGYWAVFTVVIVMQASVGGTLAAALDRIQGTLLGAVCGGLAAWLRPETTPGLAAALILAVAVTSFCAALRPALRVAPVTAVIMLITPSGAHTPLTTALYRIIEIAIGSGVGVAATFLLFPTRSAELARRGAASALEQLAALLDGWADRLLETPEAGSGDAAQGKIRAALSLLETTLDHADREQALRLSGPRLSRALPRTLWRVRNDCVSLSRALGPMPEAAAALVAEPMRAFVRAEAALMRRCAHAALAARKVARDGEPEALLAFEEAVASLRRSRHTHALDLEPVGRLFGLVFALESLHRNLNDLADRIDEAASVREV